MPALLLRIALVALSILAITATAEADPVVPGEEHCVVNVRSDDTLNMRAQPASDARTVARKRYGECGILVTGACRAGWCPAEDGHMRGWVHQHYISMVSPAMYCVSGVAPGDSLNVRAYPSLQSRVITRLNRRQCGIAFLPYAVGNWQKIRVEGWQGWINRRYLSGQ